MNKTETAAAELKAFRWFDPEQICSAIAKALDDRGTFFEVDPCFPVYVRCDARGDFYVLYED